MAGLLCVILLPGAQAGWNKTDGSTYNYTNTANWDGGIIDHQITNTLTGNQTIEFTGNAAVTNLTYAPSGAVNTPTPQFRSSGGPFTLTMNGTTRFVPWVNVSGFVGPRLALGGAGNQALNISLAGAAPALVSEYSGSQNSYLRFLNVISGNTALATDGRGLIALEGANSFTGPLNVQAGMVRLQAVSGALTASTITLAPGARFELSSVDLNGNNATNNNRLSDSVTVNLNGGYSALPGYESYANPFSGNFLSSGARGATNVSETIGTINLQSGLSRVSARVYESGTTDGSTTLMIGSLNRAVGAAVAFSGGRRDGNLTTFYGLGGALNGGSGPQSYIKFTTPPAMTQGMLPYAIIHMDAFSGQYTTNTEFASYDATDGIVPYSRSHAYVYTIAASASANDNVVATNTETVSASKTVNSLTLRGVSGSYNVTIGSGQKLTIASGAILKHISAASTIEVLGSGSSLGFNNQEAFVYVTGGRLKLSSALVDIGAGGINLCGPVCSGYQGNAGIELATLGLGTAGTSVRILMGTVSETAGQLTDRALTINNGGTYSIRSVTGNTPSMGSLAGDGTIRLSWNYTATNTANTLTIGSLNTDTTFAGSIHAGELSASSPVGFANTLVTGGNIIKTGTGSLTLSGLSSYNGTTTVRQGTLIAGADVVSTTVYGTSVTVDYTTDTLTLGSGSLSNGNVVYFSAGTVPGGLLADQPYIVRDASGSTFKVSQYVGGPAVDITSNGATVTAVRPGAFGSGTSAIILGDASTGANTVSLLAGGAYTIERDITVASQGTGTTIGGLTDTNATFSGAITLAKDVWLSSITTGSNSMFFTGAMTGAGGVVKVGAGVVTLAGADKTYIGATMVSNGTLRVNGAIAGTGSDLAVASGGTLAGTGRVDRIVVVASNAVLSAGAATNTVGTFTIASNLTLQAGAIVNCDYNGSQGDSITVSGTVDLPATLTINLAVTNVVGKPPEQIPLFTAGSFTGATSLKNWIVQGTGLGDYQYRAVRTDSTHVILARTGQGTMMLVW